MKTFPSWSGFFSISTTRRTTVRGPHPPAGGGRPASYHWPGNVRELQNYVERSVVMAAGDELTVDLLPDALISGSLPRSGRSRPADLETLTYELVQQGLATASAQEDNLHAKIVNRVERELIVQVMASCESVQTKAASRLGINRNTLQKKIARRLGPCQGTTKSRRRKTKRFNIGIRPWPSPKAQPSISSSCNRRFREPIPRSCWSRPESCPHYQGGPPSRGDRAPGPPRQELCDKPGRLAADHHGRRTGAASGMELPPTAFCSPTPLRTR